jgi:PAS domain S-box-containing protein
MTEKKRGQALRERAESRVRERAVRTTENLEALPPEELKLALHELRVHQIELEMQNEELRRTETELAASRARYLDLYELAPVGYFTFSEKGLILEANLTAATLFGVVRSALVKRPLSRFILPEDKDIHYLHCKQLFETGAPQAWELRLLRKETTPFWARVEATTTQDADGASVCRAVVTDVTRRRRAEDAQQETIRQLESALAEKTVLLQEVHHRVKNNLTVISSLLRLRANIAESSEAKQALAESQQRVHSMALVHEHLYENDHLGRINFSQYARQLVQGLYATLVGEPGRISIEIDFAPIELDIERAVPCALILNELVSNAFKYAFPGRRDGKILASFRESGSGFLELAIEDTGIGLPAGILGGGETKSLGLRIVRILTKQLNGSLEQETCPGTRIVLRFPADSTPHGQRREPERSA